jgi:signal transduction histidine kinase
VAAPQFAPSIVGGIFWTGATRAGALAGLTGGFVLWIYTLLLPSFARSGWIAESFVTEGPFGVTVLRPYELLGLTGLDSIAHAVFWTLVVNIGLYVAVSLVTSQTIIERSQANQFVDIFGRGARGERIWRGRATIGDLRLLLARFIGEPLTEAAFQRFARERDHGLDDTSPADADTVSYVERQLAGAIGASSARIMVASVLREEMHDIDEVMQILDEASELIVYSRRLEEKSQELETATNELRAANERLKELDKLKDDFVTTVSHELRTPLTSIRSFSEIVRDNPELPLEERREFLRIIVQESERLTRLLNDILDLAKMEAGKGEWHMADIAPRAVLEQAMAATKGLFRKHEGVQLKSVLDDDLPMVHADPDRLTQVVVNLISNAVKFSDKKDGLVCVEARRENGALRVDVRDNGIGIDHRDHRKIFDRFQQAGSTLTDKPPGTGLGLPICREILRYFNGEIWLESEVGKGATFSFSIPAAGTQEGIATPPKTTALETA